MYLGWLLGACALLTSAGPTLAADQPPNIVLILTDDLGWGDVGFNGRTEWRTPNLDRLATEGTVFRRWYAPGVVCAPSRAALLTGKYGIHNGVTTNNADLPREEVTVARALQERGYATALFGKWHSGRPLAEKGPVHPLERGFDEFFGFLDAVHAWQQFPKELWFGAELRPVHGYANILFTDHGLDFIRHHQNHPFFLYLPYTAVHLHIQAPQADVAEFLGKFPEKDARHPVNATYAAMVTRLDKEVGRILTCLDELGLTQNTLVVFSSDQGATFESGNEGASAFHDSNRPFRGGKRTVWEGGIRVPGVVRWPGHVPAGKVSSEIVHMIDLMPTFLSAARATPSASWQIDGADMLPCWFGTAKASERTLFWEWRSEGYNQLAAMNGRYKLVTTGNNRPELFDVEGDPAERRNIIEEHKDLATQLRQQLRKWLATEKSPASTAPAP